MTDVILKDPVLDGGIEVLNTAADAIWVCDGTPVNYGDAETKVLGSKSFTAGTVFGSPTNASPNGRQVTSVPVTDGLVNFSGTVTCWAVVDTINDLLLAVGNLTGSMAVTAGWAWTLDAFTIRVPAAASAAYVGPGDVVSGALAWWGLRAYDAAYAASLGPCIDVVKTTDGSGGGTINVKADGSLDVATIAAFGYGVSVSKIYDQTGNGIHLIQPPLAWTNMPPLTLSAFGSLPGMAFVAASDHQLIKVAAGLTATQPFSVSTVARRTGGDFTNGAIFGGNGGLGVFWGLSNAAATMMMLAGNFVTGSGTTENILNSIHYIFNGAASHFVANGVSGSAVNTDTGGISGSDTVILAGSTTGALTGSICEQGIWPGALSSGDKTDLADNEMTYWGI